MKNEATHSVVTSPLSYSLLCIFDATIKILPNSVLIQNISKSVNSVWGHWQYNLDGPSICILDSYQFLCHSVYTKLICI